MKRFLVFVGLVGAATYMFAPPRIAPQDQPEAVQSEQPVSGPLRTSWGSTLQSLRREPASSQDPASQDIASSRSKSLKTEPDRLLVVGGSDGDMVEWARTTLAAYRQASKPHAAVRSDSTGPEMWVVGQTNGWVQREDSTTDERGLLSYEYLAAIDDLSFGQSAAQTTETPPAQAASTKTQKPSHVAKRARRIAKPVAHTRDDIKVAKPFRPRGLFARSGNRQRGRGLFSRFSGRKTERRAWSVGPAG